MKDERVQGMFNYLNGSGSSIDHQRQQQQQQQQAQQQHSNDRRPARSSSGSGGDSDESRSNRATRNSNTPSPVNPTTDGSSPTDMENSSHSGGSNRSSCRSSSQLRQMLLAGESGGSRTKSCSSSSQCSSRSNTTQHSSIDDSNNVYKKFKTNIHQRFTADLEHVFPQSSCVMTPSSGSSVGSSLQEQAQQTNNHQLAERTFDQCKNKCITLLYVNLYSSNILFTFDRSGNQKKEVRHRHHQAQQFKIWLEQ